MIPAQHVPSSDRDPQTEADPFHPARSSPSTGRRHHPRPSAIHEKRRPSPSGEEGTEYDGMFPISRHRDIPASGAFRYFDKAADTERADSSLPSPDHASLHLSNRTDQTTSCPAPDRRFPKEAAGLALQSEVPRPRGRCNARQIGRLLYA